MSNPKSIERSEKARPRWLVRGAVLVLMFGFGAAGLYMLAVVPPTPDSLYPGCQFHKITGLHCPGCGMTRSVHSLLNGRITQAVAYNALLFLIAPFAAWSLGRSLWFWAVARPVPVQKRSTLVFTWILTGLLLAFGVLRNIPAYPFDLLAPHELARPLPADGGVNVP